MVNPDYVTSMSLVAVNSVKVNGEVFHYTYNNL